MEVTTPVRTYTFAIIGPADTAADSIEDPEWQSCPRKEFPTLAAAGKIFKIDERLSPILAGLRQEVGNGDFSRDTVPLERNFDSVGSGRGQAFESQ